MPKGGSGFSLFVCICLLSLCVYVAYYFRLFVLCTGSFCLICSLLYSFMLFTVLLVCTVYCLICLRCTPFYVLLLTVLFVCVVYLLYLGVV